MAFWERAGNSIGKGCKGAARFFWVIFFLSVPTLWVCFVVWFFSGKGAALQGSDAISAALAALGASIAFGAVLIAFLIGGLAFLGYNELKKLAEERTRKHSEEYTSKYAEKHANEWLERNYPMICDEITRKLNDERKLETQNVPSRGVEQEQVNREEVKPFTSSTPETEAKD